MVASGESTRAVHSSMEPMKIASNHQLLYFDLVRALSAQMVLVGHSLNLFMPEVFMGPKLNGHYVTTTGMFYMQNMGVVLFFVLSGYLVTRSVVHKRQTPNYRFREYLIERSARVFVPFFPAVILVGIFDWLLVSPSGSPFVQLRLDIGTISANFLPLKGR